MHNKLSAPLNTLAVIGNHLPRQCGIATYTTELCAARSANGANGWQIDAQPTMPADPEHRPEELWGIEDPRITYVSELERFAVVYTSYARGEPGVSLALATASLSELLGSPRAYSRPGVGQSV